MITILSNLIPATYHTQVDYDLVFDNGQGNGFAFPCTADGELLPEINPAAYVSYLWCMQSPSSFKRFNKVVERKYRIREDAHGTCTCGCEVWLIDQYCGACQCPGCGRWYNLFGQELMPPEQWEK